MTDLTTNPVISQNRIFNLTGITFSPAAHTGNYLQSSHSNFMLCGLYFGADFQSIESLIQFREYLKIQYKGMKGFAKQKNEAVKELNKIIKALRENS